MNTRRRPRRWLSTGRKQVLLGAVMIVGALLLIQFVTTALDDRNLRTQARHATGD